MSIADLKALVESWRDRAVSYEIKARHAKTAREMAKYDGMREAMSQCAESLEQALKGSADTDRR